MLFAKLKMSTGNLLALGAILFGVVGMLLEVLKQLPPGIDFKFAPTLVAILGLIINGLGLQDAIEGGKREIWDTLLNFFKNPYRHLALSAVLFALGQFVGIPGLDPTAQVIAKLILVIASVLKLEGGTAAARAFINTRRLTTGAKEYV